jgi:hypothetical protein
VRHRLGIIVTPLAIAKHPAGAVSHGAGRYAGCPQVHCRTEREALPITSRYALNGGDALKVKKPLQPIELTGGSRKSEIGSRYNLARRHPESLCAKSIKWL